MKLPSQTSFAQQRPLIVAAFAVVLGAATALAQSSTSGSSSSSSSSPSSSSTSTKTPNAADASTYHSGTAPADVDSTKEINAQNGSTTTGAGAMTGRDSTGKNKLSWMDRRFVNKAADGGQDEIALAKLAAEKASNADVKSFAQKLVEDHEQVASELKSIADQKNVKIDEDNDHDRTYKRLAKRSGGDFDREFVEHMIDEHEKDIKMFEKAAKEAKDPDVRSFASKHVDHLRAHLQQAQSLRQTVMPTGRMDDNSGRSSGASSSTDANKPHSSSNENNSSGSESSYGTSGTGSGTSATTGTTGTSGDTSTKPKSTGSR